MKWKKANTVEILLKFIENCKNRDKIYSQSLLYMTVHFPGWCRHLTKEVAVLNKSYGPKLSLLVN